MSNVTFTTTTNSTVVENWNWADEIVQSSNYCFFPVDETFFNEETGQHIYHGEFPEMLVVEPNGEVYLTECE